MRGLIEKTSAVGDSRSTHYQLTTEFLQQMGVQKVEELPEYQSFKEKLNLPETVNTASHDPEN
jgi:chromosome segregation and condensation protein ScpB